MALPNVFDQNVCDALVGRIEVLTPETKAKWGKMNAAQMLRHCNVTYEYIYEPERYKKPKGIGKWMLKTFVKKKVVGEEKYAQNSPTGPDFKVAPEQDFTMEKSRLIHFIRRVQSEGAKHFEGKESHSFGHLTANEWNNMLYKHVDHHLTQFGV